MRIYSVALTLLCFSCLVTYSPGDVWLERFKCYGQSERSRMLAAGQKINLRKELVEMNLAALLWDRDDAESTSLQARLLGKPRLHDEYINAYTKGLASNSNAKPIQKVILAKDFRKELNGHFSGAAKPAGVAVALRFARKTIDTGSRNERIAVAKLLLVICVERKSHAKDAITIMKAPIGDKRIDASERKFWSELLANAMEAIKSADAHRTSVEKS